MRDRKTVPGLAFFPASQGRSDGLTLRSLQLPLSLLVASAIIALLAPAVRDCVVARGANIEYRAIAANASRAENEAIQRDRLDGILAQIDDFRASTTSFTLLLAEVTRALPPSAHLVAASFDSTGVGSISGVASHADVVVDAIERTPDLANITVDGPITEGLIDGLAQERTTVRFTILLRGRRK